MYIYPLINLRIFSLHLTLIHHKIWNKQKCERRRTIRHATIHVDIISSHAGTCESHMMVRCAHNYFSCELRNYQLYMLYNLFILTNALYTYCRGVWQPDIYIVTCRAIAFVLHALINSPRRVTTPLFLSGENCFRSHLPLSIQYSHL